MVISTHKYTKDFFGFLFCFCFVFCTAFNFVLRHAMASDTVEICMFHTFKGKYERERFHKCHVYQAPACGFVSKINIYHTKLTWIFVHIFYVLSRYMRLMHRDVFNKTKAITSNKTRAIFSNKWRPISSTNTNAILSTFTKVSCIRSQCIYLECLYTIYMYTFSDNIQYQLFYNVFSNLICNLGCWHSLQNSIL